MARHQLESIGDQPHRRRELGAVCRDLAQQLELDTVSIEAMSRSLFAGALAGQAGHRELRELVSRLEQLVAKLIHNKLVNARNARQGDQRILALATSQLKHRGALDASESSELFEALWGQDHLKKFSWWGWASLISTGSMGDELTPKHVVQRHRDNAARRQQVEQPLVQPRHGRRVGVPQHNVAGLQPPVCLLHHHLRGDEPRVAE